MFLRVCRGIIGRTAAILLRIRSAKKDMAIIAHIDLDSFFASCEAVRDESLEDKPIIICMYSGRSEDSGAVSTCNYPARSLGIHAGMAIQQAKELARDDAAFLPAEKSYYKEVSGRIMAIIAEHAADTEVASIDEAYADLSDCDTYVDAVERAEHIRDVIKEQEGLTASVGIGPNKLVAKMASDEDKPDGLTVVRPDNAKAFLGNMPVDELYSVGPKTADALREMGAETVADVREISVQRLVHRFGETRGVELREKANGDGATMLESREKKQLSRITTLPQNTRQMKDIRPVVRELADDVIKRVEQHEKRFSTVAGIVITANRETRTRQRSFQTAISSKKTLYETAEELIQEYLEDNPDIDARRVGVRVAGLSDAQQTGLDRFA